jgi:hypothetical protein
LKFEGVKLCVHVSNVVNVNAIYRLNIEMPVYINIHPQSRIYLFIMHEHSYIIIWIYDDICILYIIYNIARYCQKLWATPQNHGSCGHHSSGCWSGRRIRCSWWLPIH